MAKILLGMSGGVDSSVAAALLQAQGHEVTGVFLYLWSDDSVPDRRDNPCCSLESMEDARRVATKLGIPFYVFNVREAFKQQVVDPWLNASFAGQTPNPCLTCNREIKIGHLLERAEALGMDGAATGHFARTRQLEDGRVELLRAVDAAKDQTYFLARLEETQLRNVHFPVGEMTKEQVRAEARRLELPVAEKKESQELSFIADDVPSFLKRNAAGRMEAGSVRDLDGRVYPQQHEGLALYTIGQRRGLPISGIASPRYVVGRDAATNTLIVGGEAALDGKACQVGDLVWRGEMPKQLKCEVQIRSRAIPASATIQFEKGEASIHFDTAQRAITPGQAAVFYQGEVCLGAGVISGLVD